MTHWLDRIAAEQAAANGFTPEAWATLIRDAADIIEAMEFHGVDDPSQLPPPSPAPDLPQGWGSW